MKHPGPGWIAFIPRVMTGIKPVKLLRFMQPDRKITTRTARRRSKARYVIPRLEKQPPPSITSCPAAGSQGCQGLRALFILMPCRQKAIIPTGPTPRTLISEQPARNRHAVPRRIKWPCFTTTTSRKDRQFRYCHHPHAGRPGIPPLTEVHPG